MINLFNIDINKIKHNGSEVALMKLNDNIVYEKKIPFTISYTVYPYDYYLDYIDYSYAGTSYAIGLPKIYIDDETFNYEYSNIIITKKDGTTTSSTHIRCIDIEKVTISYPPTTYAIDFFYPQNALVMYGPVVKEILYCDTSNFVSLSYMFSKNIKEIKDIERWDTSNVTNMSHMFNGCSNLTSLDLSNWDVYNVTDMSYMFNECRGLTTLNLSNWKLNILTLEGMFYNVPLHTLRLDNCYRHTIELIITYGGLSPNTINGVTKTIYCKKSQVTGLEPPAGWEFSYVYEEESEIPAYPLYTEGKFKNNSNLTSVDVMVNETHTNLNDMFYGCTALTTINGIEYWNTSNVTTMENMFYNCTSLIELDLSSFDISSVTSMFRMFCGCESLETLNLSSFDMVNATGNLATHTMFARCYNLTNLQAPRNINNNIDFSDCTLLTHDSLMSIIDNLMTVTSTKTLTLGADNLAKLSDEEKAIATGKGWTLK